MYQPQTPELKAKVKEIFNQVPVHKQRIAGKSIPLEKFSVQKARKSLQHGWSSSLAGLVSSFDFQNIRHFQLTWQKLEDIFVFSILQKTWSNVADNKSLRHLLQE